MRLLPITYYPLPIRLNHWFKWLLWFHWFKIRNQKSEIRN